MANKYINTIFAGKIREELAKLHPTLRNNAISAPLVIDTIRSPDIPVTDFDVFNFQLSSGPGKVTPDIDIAIFKQTYGALEASKKLQPDDIPNYPDLTAGNPNALDKRMHSVDNACVIVVQSRNGFIPFSHVRICDGIRHRGLSATFGNAAFFGKKDFDYPSPKVIAAMLSASVQKYADLEERFNQGIKNTHELFKSAKDVLNKKGGYNVTMASFMSTTSTLSLDVDVKKSPLVGMLKEKFFEAASNGSYSMKLRVLNESYYQFKKSPAYDRGTVLNADDIKKAYEDLIERNKKSHATSESEIDFRDRINAAPVVEIKSLSSTGHMITRYVVLPDHKDMPKADKVFNQALHAVMKNEGPARPL